MSLSCVATSKDRSNSSTNGDSSSESDGSGREALSPPPVSAAVLASLFDTGRFAIDKEGLVVVGVWLRGSDRQVFRQGQGCRLRMRERTSGVEKMVTLVEPITAEALNPGVWDVKRLGCGVGKVWELDGLFQSGLSVKKGEVAFAGWMILENDRSQPLVIREATREYNLQLASQVQSEQSQSALLSVPLVSAFTGKVLPRPLRVSDDVVRIQSKSIHLSSPKAKAPEQHELSSLLQNAQACATDGMRKDPLRAGTIELESEYRKGVSTGVKSASANGANSKDHAMRDDLELCFIKALSQFSNPSSGDFQLRLNY